MRLMLSSFTLATLVALTTLAAADPAPLSAAAQKTYAAQLGKGRQLEAAGKHAEAIAAFEAGLVAAPGDATLLGELGASAYLAKDLAKAETSTRKAIANAAAPGVRGASLYNLGRIQEDRKDTAGAVASYTQSLIARPNSVVRARLAKLDPKAAAALEPYMPVPLAGPFASVDAFCKAIPVDPNDEPDLCTCGIAKSGSMTVTAPYQQVQWVTKHCGYHESDGYYDEYKLGVKLATGWYFAAVERSDVGNHCTIGYTGPDDHAKDGTTIVGDKLVVVYSDDGGCSNGSGETQWTETKQVIVGIGASKVPAATTPMLRKRHQTSQDLYGHHPTVDSDIALDVTWAADGSFTVGGKTKGLDPTEAGNLLGKHVLAFP